MKNNTLNEKKDKNKLLIRLEIFVITMMMTTAPAFAGVANIGSNIGNWGVEQMGWIALFIIAFATVGFLIKKAWIPCGVFLLVGAVLLYIIKNPDQLDSIGAALFNIAVQ